MKQTHPESTRDDTHKTRHRSTMRRDENPVLAWTSSPPSRATSCAQARRSNQHDIRAHAALSCMSNSSLRADSALRKRAVCVCDVSVCSLPRPPLPPRLVPVTFCAPPKRALSSFMPWFTSMICAPAMSCIAIEDVMMGAIPVRKKMGGGAGSVAALFRFLRHALLGSSIVR